MEPDKNKHKLTPHSLSSPDGNKGHSIHSMGENQEPDPTDNEAPDLRMIGPERDKKNKDKKKPSP